jgi:hypothetical protein
MEAHQENQEEKNSILWFLVLCGMVASIAYGIMAAPPVKITNIRWHKIEKEEYQVTFTASNTSGKQFYTTLNITAYANTGNAFGQKSVAGRDLVGQEYIRILLRPHQVMQGQATVKILPYPVNPVKKVHIVPGKIVIVR